MTERSAEHADMLSGGEQQFGPIELGSIGWDGDSGDPFDIDKAEGTTLVKVQLFRGRDVTDRDANQDPARAHGQRILARLSASGGWSVPPINTEVAVAFPAGLGDNPGGPFILAVLGASPKIQFSGARTVMDFGNQNVIIRGKAIALQTNSGHFLSMSDDGGIQIITRSGNGLTIDASALNAFAQKDGDAKTNFTIDADGIQQMVKGGGFTLVDADGFTAGGQSGQLLTGSVKLGANATPATPVVSGVSGQTGVGSTTVFCQP